MSRLICRIMIIGLLICGALVSGASLAVAKGDDMQVQAAWSNGCTINGC